MRLNDAFAFIPVIRASNRPPEALAELKRLGLKDVSLENRLEVRNEGGKREIVLIGAVGGSWWDDSGITEKEFRNALGQFPKGSGNIDVLVNSEGGSVQEGLGIYNAIKERSEEITVRIVGYAVSIASVFPLAAHKVISPKSAIWMMHRAWSYAQGNDEDMEKAAAMLREHNETLVDIYVAETGKTREEWEAWMKAETWVRGSKAIEYGLADETDEEDETQAAYRPLHPDFIQRCKNISPEILNVISVAAAKGDANTKHQKPDTAAAHNSPAPQGKNQTVMNKQKMLALLKTWGVEVNDAMTDDQLIALVEAGKPAKTESKSAIEGPATKAEITEAMAQLRKDIVHENAVVAQLATLVTERRITQATADKLRDSAIKDATILAALKENPQMPEAAEPVAGGVVEMTGDASISEIEKGFASLRAPIVAIYKSDNDPDVKAIQRNAIAIAQLVSKHGEKLRHALNANTVSTDLKKNVILTTSMRAFKRRLCPLGIFSTRFNNVPLEGTNKIAVPYYPLDTATSNDFSDGTGYEFNESSATEDKDVTINKRKYKPFNFYSHELSRQPFFDTARLMAMKAEQLGLDVWLDVLSVFTLADYGAAVHAEPSDSFDAENVIDIGGACDDADWPDVGRSLVLDTPYHTNLKKDLVRIGSDATKDQALREGSTGRVDRFEIFHTPRFPENSENLVGLACLPSAALVATSPIMPGPGVRRQLISYDIVTDPDLGISFEYRYWGNADQDEEREVVECNYGFLKGQTEAAKRITNQ